MINAQTNNCHMMAVYHVGDDVCELTYFNSCQISAQSDMFRIGCQIFREFMVMKTKNLEMSS